MVSAWYFSNNESIWPLPHVLFAYHGYMYTRDWKSVLCGYYVYKTLELFCFALVGYAYYSYFPQLVEENNEWNLIEKWYVELNGNPGSYETYNRTSNQGSTLYRSDTRVEAADGGRNSKGWEKFDSCYLDCNDLFIGGTVQTLLGILLGMVQLKLFFSGDKSNSFHLVTFWKDSFLKHDAEYVRLTNHSKERFKKNTLFTKYGLWPPSIVFGTREVNRLGLPYVVGWKIVSDLRDREKMSRNSQRSDDGDEGDDSLENAKEERKRIFEVVDDSFAEDAMDGEKGGAATVSEKDKDMEVMRGVWYFRKVFWKRWLQVTMLGFPATLFYTVKGSGEIQAGLVVYCFVSCFLLLIFKRANETIYLNYIDHGTYDDRRGEARYVEEVGVKTTNAFDLRMSMYFNGYERFYVVWIFTTAFLCLFQTVPVMSSFYKVLCSSALVVVSCLAAKLSKKFFRRENKKKQTWV